MSALPGTTGRRRVYLMRHGHVDYFSPEVIASGDYNGVPLTPLGREQAVAAGDALADIPFDRAVCSGYRRTEETARLVLSRHTALADLPLESEAELVELHGSTDAQPMSREKFAAAMAFQFDNAAEPGARMGLGTDGELFAEAAARAERAFIRLLSEPGWATMLIVAHEGINRLILGWASGAGLKGVQAFEQDTACINILDFDLVPAEAQAGNEIRRAMIKALNLTPYNHTKFGMNMTSLERIMTPVEAHH